MRWLEYGFENDNGTWDLKSDYTLQELYDEQERLEDILHELREKEPSSKRKYEREHEVWFSLCQSYIDQLKEVRDMIVQKKDNKKDR